MSVNKVKINDIYGFISVEIIKFFLASACNEEYNKIPIVAGFDNQTLPLV